MIAPDRGAQGVSLLLAPQAWRRRQRGRQTACAAHIHTQRSRQIDGKRGAFAWFAAHRDLASVVADHGLYDGQAQAGAVGLSRVIRREEAVAFLLGEALAGVGDFQTHAAFVRDGTDGQDASGGHGVDGVQYQVLQGAA